MESGVHMPGVGERMGCLGQYPHWLQRFGVAQFYLAAISSFAMFQAMTQSGLVPVVISSLEKRYGLNSKESGFLVSWYDAIVAVAVVIITHYGHRAHRPLWLARSMLILTVGCAFFTMPKFVGSHYSPLGGFTGSETCPVQSSNDRCAASQFALYGFFIVGQFFMAVASAPVYTLGVTFIDDNAPPNKASVFVGVFYMCAALGPAIGYLLEGMFLNHWVDPGVSTTLTPASSAWVGAWWAGFVFAGGMAFLLSPLMFVIPKQLPGTEWIRELRSSQKSQHQLNGFETTDTSSLKANIASLCRNKPFLFTQFGGAAESLVIIGIGAFLPKLVQTQFLLSSADASFLTGVSVIIGAAGGSVLGGILARRWTPKQNARNTVIFAFISFLCSFCCLIHCAPISLVGVSVPYPLANTSTAACSVACNCSDSVYKPMCAPSGSTFASVCHAGCTTALSPTLFTNCSCLSSLDDQLSEGKCRSGCGLLPLFLFVLLILMLTTFVYQVPITIVTLRCVEEHQRSLALGIGSLLYRSLGAIPGPLIVGAVLDHTCILWQTNCDGSTGACWEYDSKKMSVGITLCLLSFKLCSLICFGLANYHFQPSASEDNFHKVPSSSSITPDLDREAAPAEHMSLAQYGTPRGEEFLGMDEDALSKETLLPQS